MPYLIIYLMYSRFKAFKFKGNRYIIYFENFNFHNIENKNNNEF